MNTDVLVIGGGPAGAAAAIGCARRGLAVTLLEAAHFSRHRPGETLHPGIEPLLARLDSAALVNEAGYLRHAGIWVERGETRVFHAYGADAGGRWQGYQAPRADFDCRLLARARAWGVTVLQPQRALTPLHDGARVTGALTSAGPIAAQFTVDASGSGRWLGRRLGLPAPRATPRWIAYYGYVRGDCPARDEAPCFRHLPEGWEWQARVGLQRYHWTRLAPCAADPAGLPPAFAGLAPEGRPRGADVSWRLQQQPAGPGYFIVGDAARVTDPSSSHGVLQALMSGMLAAHLIRRSLDERAAEARAATAFGRYMQQGFAHDHAGLLGEPVPAWRPPGLR